MDYRRFPPPWSVEKLDACFVVKDHGGQKLAYVYFEEEPGGFNTTAMSRTRSSVSVLRSGLLVFCAGATILRYLSGARSGGRAGKGARTGRHRNRARPSAG